MDEFDLRVQDIMGNSLEAAEVLIHLDSALEALEEYNKMFPLQTIQSMAERWGVNRQTVNNWADRHSDFPIPLEGIIEKTAKTPQVFALYDVERYEKVRGLVK